MYYMITTNELYHHGIKGMHWGIRRFQPYGEGYEGSHGKFTGSKRGGKRSNGSNRYGDPRKKHNKYSRSNKYGRKEQSFSKDVENELTKRAKKNTVKAAASIGMAITAAVISSVAIKRLVQKGSNVVDARDSTLAKANLIRKLSKKGVSTLKGEAAKALITAGIAATTAMAIKGGREVGKAAKKGTKSYQNKRKHKKA